MSPHPRAQIHDPEAVVTVCRLTRRHYGACLGVAVVEDWAWFGCSGCDSFVPLNRYELRRDADGMARMWAQAFASTRSPRWKP